MSKNNKEFSTRQEAMVAKFMGWKVVAGSGSRPFTPGDVFDEHFLVECKTHTEPQSKVIFYQTHWKKISEEAQAKHKTPVLVVDTGTQLSNNTWVMLPSRSLPFEDTNKIDGLENTTRGGTTIIFNHQDMYTVFIKERNDDMVNYFVDKFEGSKELLAIMTLSEFKEYYIREYET